MEKPLSSPRISVVIPVYNAELYLCECLDTLLGQTFDDIEIICVDDESTDISLQILEKYQNQDARVKVYSQKKSNAGAIRNFGLGVALGKYIYFMDADDFCKKTLLQDLYEEAEKTQADIVVCESLCYSERKKEFSKPGYMVREDLLPNQAVFSYRDCKDNIFQLFGMAPWNKLFRLDMLRKSKIQAQSIPAANDVLLTASALVSAERITVLKRALYVQRKEVVNSITANLAQDNKWRCAYESSLALKQFLESNNYYNDVKKSFQKLAIHNLLWYLKRQEGKWDIYAEYYQCLKNSWLHNLDLLNLSEYVISDRSDFQQYSFLCSKTLEEVLCEKIVALEKENRKVAKKLKSLKNSKGYRLGKAVLYVPRKIKRTIKLFSDNRIVKQEERKELAVRKRSKKRICVVAYENYHFNVVANTIKLALVKCDYVEAFVRDSTFSEVSAMLGESDVSRVVWHVYPKKQKEYNKTKSGENNWILAASEIVATRNQLDIVLLPSPEYSPQNYRPIFENRNRSYRLIAMVHNLNRVFLDSNRDTESAKMLSLADGYVVLDSSLSQTIQELEMTDKKVYCLPMVFEKRESKNCTCNADRLNLVITGGVERDRKDYDVVVRVLGSLGQMCARIRIVLLGNADNPYGRTIVGKLKELTGQGLTLVSYEGYVGNDTFDLEMYRADCVLAPVQVHTKNEQFDEVYGRTKMTGIVGDMIKYAVPAIVPSDLNMPKELEGSFLTYSSDSELGSHIVDLLDFTKRKHLQECAQENSEKFLIDNVVESTNFFDSF